MADDPELIKQDEIESLLEGADLSGGGTDSDGSEPVRADEIDSLLNSVATADSDGPLTPQPRTSSADSAGNRTGDDVQFLLDQAEEALASADRPVESELGSSAAAFQLPEFAGSALSTDKATLDLLSDVELDLRIELGRADMYLEEVLRLRRGSVVPLDKLAGDPVDIFVNGRLIARGEVLVMNDNFCVRVAELISGDE